MTTRVRLRTVPACAWTAAGGFVDILLGPGPRAKRSTPAAARRLLTLAHYPMGLTAVVVVGGRQIDQGRVYLMLTGSRLRPHRTDVARWLVCILLVVVGATIGAVVPIVQVVMAAFAALVLACCLTQLVVRWNTLRVTTPTAPWQIIFIAARTARAVDRMAAALTAEIDDDIALVAATSSHARLYARHGFEALTESAPVPMIRRAAADLGSGRAGRPGRMLGSAQN